MIIVTDSDSIKNYREFELKWERKMFYGYDGPEDGFYKWLDTKQQEFESSNKQRRISFKNSNKMAKRTRNSALLSKQKGGDIIQDKAMYIPCGAALIVGLNEPWLQSDKIWDSFCEADEIKIRLSQYLSNRNGPDGCI